MIATLVQAPATPAATAQNRTVRRARFAAIDFHAHLGRWLAPEGDWVASDLAGRHDRPWMVEDVDALLELLDSHNVAGSVNLDGRWGTELEANLDRYDRAHPGRFFTFCQLDFGVASEREDFGEALARSLRSSAAAGARGLKVWKTLGLGFRDSRGELLLPHDRRLSPVFAAAGELGLPVLIHTADPVAFFRPADSDNERLAELEQHPEWSYHGPGFPSHEELMESFEALVARHPGTTFVGAHVAGWVENLHWVSRMLDDHPNLFVDFAARLPDLGRQPRAARELLLRHSDRVLFGTDELPPSAAGYRRYLRFLETADEGYVHAGELPPPTGSWTVSALDLPDQALRAIYSDNAHRLLGLPERRNGVEQA
jgi:predicted TIM-barrel fold metal-dependent hydrolase